MLRLALPRATQLTQDRLPIGIDTWECSQPGPPPLATSVRSFARRAAAAAIRRGLGPDLPVVIWVTGATGLRWSDDELDVDPSLVAVCVVVDTGEEQAEKDLGAALRGGPLESRVRWVHAPGPGHASELVRRGVLPVGLPPVKAYMRERLLWHAPSALERALARLVQRALTDNDNDDEAAAEEDGPAGTLAAVQLRRAVWRCFYKPPLQQAAAPKPLPPPAPPSSSSSPSPSSSVSPRPPLLPRLESRGSRFFEEIEEEREEAGGAGPAAPRKAIVASASAQTPARRLVVKVFDPASPARRRALAVEAEAYRLLELVATREEAALALPPLVGVAQPAACGGNGCRRRQHDEEGKEEEEEEEPVALLQSAAALVLEDAAARGWLMLGEEQGEAAVEEAEEDGEEQNGSRPFPQLEPVAPATQGSAAAAAALLERPSPGGPPTAAARRRELLPLPEERVLQTVRCLAWLHAQHWRGDAGGVVEEGGGGGGGGGDGRTISPMWQAEAVNARAGRLQAALRLLEEQQGRLPLSSLSLSVAALAALGRLAAAPELLAALYRPQVSSEEAQRWGLPDWVVGEMKGLTVVHGSLTWRKLGFEVEEEGEQGGVLAVGWEEACLGPGAWDVALLLASSSLEPDGSTSSRLDDAWVLGAYQAELAKAGVDGYSLEAARHDYARAQLGLAPELLVALTERPPVDEWETKALVGALEHAVRQLQWM